MALALHFDGLIHSGKVTNYAELVRLGNVTRARVTQIMNLLMLAPRIQEELLFPPQLERGRGEECLRYLQAVAGVMQWSEIGGLPGLWQATSNGGKNLVPKVWGGKFPYQVKVKLAIPKVNDVPKTVLKKLGVDAAVGRFDNCLDEDTADDLVQSLLGKSPHHGLSPVATAYRPVGTESQVEDLKCH